MFLFSNLLEVLRPHLRYGVIPLKALARIETLSTPEYQLTSLRYLEAAVQ